MTIKLKIFSAGVECHELDPNAVKVMTEAGVDISKQSSKHLDSLKDTEFDYIITLSDDVRENCPPYLPKAGIIHKNFDDPPHLSYHSESEEEAIEHYRVCPAYSAFWLPRRSVRASANPRRELDTWDTPRKVALAKAKIGGQ